MCIQTTLLKCGQMFSLPQNMYKTEVGRVTEQMLIKIYPSIFNINKNKIKKNKNKNKMEK